MDKRTTITETASFRKLVKSRWTVSIALTITILAVYFGFIILIAFNKEILAMKTGEKITAGIPIGLGIIFFAWILTGIYVIWANRSYDKSVEKIKNEFLNNQL